MPDPTATPPDRHLLRWLGVAAVILVLPVLIFGGVNWVFDRYAPPDDTASTRRLHAIGQVLRQWADDHGGRYPNSWAVLVDAGVLSRDQLVCPAAAGGPLEYVYAGRGLVEQSTPNSAVLAYEPLAVNGGRGSRVLYADGSDGWIEAAALPAELARARPPVQQP